MVVAKEIEMRVRRIGADTVFSVADLGLPQGWYDNVRVKLSRMASLGHIVKVGKGKYFKPRETVFGSLDPSREEVVKDLLVKDGKTVGYLTGYSVWNKMGLTTQIPNVIEIGANTHRNRMTRGGYEVRFVLQPNPITRQNVSLLQLLDAVKSVKSIPDTSVDETIRRLKSMVRALSDKDKTTLTALALKYPPQTRALIGAVFENIGNNDLSARLHDTLNPMTKFNVGVSVQALPNLKDWNIQ